MCIFLMQVLYFEIKLQDGGENFHHNVSAALSSSSSNFMTFVGLRHLLFLPFLIVLRSFIMFLNITG